MAFAEFGDVRIHYELSGDASKPMLVLSHSLGVGLSMWQPQVEAFAAHFQVLRYDTRGHGESSIPVGPYSVEDLGQDVVRLLDSLGIAKASFCGLSMGGVIGQWLGIQAPERLEKLVLANTAAKIGTADTWNARIAAVLEHGLEPVIAGTLGRWFTAGFRETHRETVDVTRVMLETTQAEGYVACCAAIRDADFRTSLGSIRAPTLVVCGTNDPVTSVVDGRFLTGEIAGSTCVELAAAHLSNVEAASAFNQALLDFLVG